MRSFRNELLDHVIVVNQRHFRRLAKDYVSYYHSDRTHDGLDKDTPIRRPVVRREHGEQILSAPRLGGYTIDIIGPKPHEPPNTILATYTGFAVKKFRKGTQQGTSSEHIVL